MRHEMSCYRMFQIDDYRWLATSIAQEKWHSICREPADNSNSLLKRLRLALPINQASMLFEQYELLALAKKKVADPRDWFWTRQLLEQSSDQETAIETALDFPDGESVWDICCGAGADAIALANRNLSVNAIDRCPIACELTRYNALSHGLKIKVDHQSAEDTVIEGGSFIHIDPDRRADGTRSSSLDRLSPSWDTIVKLLKQCQGMSLKLAPGTRVDLNGLQHRVERPPESVRFVSRDGSVRQQRWYWGLERWPTGSITASMHLNAPSTRRAMRFVDDQQQAGMERVALSTNWFHETFLADEVQSLGARSETTSPNELVADYDPSIRAAELSACFAKRYGWRLIDSSSGFLTASEALVHPMVRWFRVMDILPLDKKQIKSYAKKARVRNWELKSRGLEVDLDALRKILAAESKSDETMTILCTKLGSQHRAIFCKEQEFSCNES